MSVLRSPRAGDGLHHRAARHQPAGADRRGCRGNRSGTDGMAACAPATPASWPRWCLLITQSTIQSAQIVAPDPRRRRTCPRTDPLTERIPVLMTDPAALNAARRAADLTALADGARRRRLGDRRRHHRHRHRAGRRVPRAAVALVEKHDLAFGTSRWSSKLVHGGLRYLATRQRRHRPAQRGRARNPDDPQRSSSRARDAAAGAAAAVDEPGQPGAGAHRVSSPATRCAGWPARPRRRCRGRAGSSAARAAELVPAVRRDGLDGGLLAYDGQLIDDARLVVAVARTAAQHGARILTYVAASDVTGDSVRLTDQRTGESFDVTARAVINATGVWAGDIDSSITVAAQPRNASGVRRRGIRQSDCGTDDSDSRRDQPLRVRDARAAGPGLSGSDRRGRARTDSRCAATDFGGDHFLLDTVNTALGAQLGQPT